MGGFLQNGSSPLPGNCSRASVVWTSDSLLGMSFVSWNSLHSLRPLDQPTMCFIGLGSASLEFYVVKDSENPTVMVPSINKTSIHRKVTPTWTPNSLSKHENVFAIAPFVESKWVPWILRKLNFLHTLEFLGRMTSFLDCVFFS